MKFSVINIITASLLLSILIFTGCTKDTVVGPAGPIGATGPTGPAGNANVESYFFQTTTNWTLGAADSSSWNATYTGLTINTGYQVSVSMVTSNGNMPLSYTNYSTGIAYVYLWNLQGVTITATSITGTHIPKPANDPAFNIIIIP
jgi:hypothetical protein